MYTNEEVPNDRLKIPLGVKIIAGLYIFAALLVLFEINGPVLKDSPILIGNYFLPTPVSMYVLIGHSVTMLGLAWGLLNLRQIFFQATLVYKALGVMLILWTMLVISPKSLEVINKNNKDQNQKLTASLFRIYSLPGIMTEMLVMSYLYKRKDHFNL